MNYLVRGPYLESTDVDVHQDYVRLSILGVDSYQSLVAYRGQSTKWSEVWEDVDLGKSL